MNDYYRSEFLQVLIVEDYYKIEKREFEMKVFCCD